MALKCAIYCPESLDGVASAAVLVRMCHLKNYNYKVNFISYRTIDKDFNEMAKLENTAIFILDFSPEEVVELNKKLNKVQKNNNKLIYWNSHLPYSKQTLDLLKQNVKVVDFVGIPIEVLDQKHDKIDRCSTDLVCKKFIPTDFVSITLAKIAHDKEFWLKQDERSIKLTDVINSGFNKRELIDMLSKGVYWSQQFEQIRGEYLARREKELENLSKRMIVKNYITKKIGISFASDILSSSDAGDKLLENPEIEVATIIFKDGKISFRRSELSRINLAKLAVIFNGGGNQYASAGKINLDELRLSRIASKNDFEKVADHVDSELTKFFGA